MKILADDRPDDLADAYHAAIESGPKWRRHLENALQKMPETDEMVKKTG